jgi:ABC-type spermidine/putrescine transport system permease subunit II
MRLRSTTNVTAGSRLGRAALYALVTAVLVYLGLPSLILIPVSFNPTTVIEFPPRGFTTHWYQRYAELPGWLDATWTSVVVATFTALLSLILGTLSAHALRQPMLAGRRIIKSFALLPLIVPSLITAIAIYKLFSDLDLSGTVIGFVIAHSVLALPFVITIMSASFAGIDPKVEAAARVLGANRFASLYRITLPLVLPGLVTSALLSFLVSFDELMVALFLSDPFVSTLPKKLWDGIQMEIDPTLAAVSTIFTAVSLAILIIVALVRMQLGRDRT